MSLTHIPNRRKIINDPVYGFIQIPSDSLFHLMEHPFFQRLRRIRQLGLAFYVYPGANHSRFQHALGAAHLMTVALDVIERKGMSVSAVEREAAVAAILLHDIGHGPFSHALESILVPTIEHEALSVLFMEQLNREMGGQLELAIEIFNNRYPQSYLHQLVSSQLDMDRLDYLRRDSFFTGVSEGVFGSERIIKMLRVNDDRLVVEQKGIYSIEKYLISRRLMYWQVYLHKTVVSAEQMLVRTMQRARYLAMAGEQLFATPALKGFLYPGLLTESPLEDKEFLMQSFSELDDNDVFSALKVWARYHDPVLSRLAGGLVNRQLPAIRIRREPFTEDEVMSIRERLMKQWKLSKEESEYFVYSDRLVNNAYCWGEDEILLIDNSGELHLLSETSDIVAVPLLRGSDHKYFICFPKSLATDQAGQ